MSNVMHGSCYAKQRDHNLFSSQKWLIDNVGKINTQAVYVDPWRFSDDPEVIRQMSEFVGYPVDSRKYNCVAHVVGEGWEMYFCSFENGINTRTDVFAKVDDDVLALQLKLTNFV